MQELQQQMPSHSIELEESVLGTMLQFMETVQIVLPVLRVDDFYVPKHQIIYNAIVTLFTENKGIDIISVIEQLKKQPHRGYGDFKTQLDSVGGPYAITILTNSVRGIGTIQDHAQIIKQYSVKRKLAVLSMKLFNLSNDGTTDALELLSYADKSLVDLLNEIQFNKSMTLQTAIQETLKKIYEAGQKEGDTVGVPCGIGAVDRATMGFHAPDLIVLAANPGEGKTTLVLQWAIDIAKAGYPIGFVSLEMRSYQLVYKILSKETGISVKSLVRGLLDQSEWAKLTASSEFLNNVTFHLSDKGGMSIVDFKAMVYGWVKMMGAQIVFIDYLQLLTVFGAGKNFSTRELEISFITKQLKAICMDLNIPIIALSQMSRKEKGTQRMPILSDLRESGAIEQDADCVMFIWRPWYHKIYNDAKNMPYLKEDALLIIEKWRLHEPGIINLLFNGAQNKFVEKPAESFSPSKYNNNHRPPSNENFDEGFETEEEF